MNKNREINWKAIAIIFIILFTLESMYLIWGGVMYYQEEKKTNECYYDICSGYPDAWYENDICSCYGYSVLGDLIVVEESYMK